MDQGERFSISMKITILAVGKIKEKYLSIAIDEYSKKIRKNCDLEIIEVPDEKAPDNMSISQEIQVKKIESDKMIKQLDLSSHIMALTIDGVQKTTEKMAKKLRQLNLREIDHITFLIGGSLGLSDEIINQANEKISFSKMTFPHQLMRVILLEQVEKWVSI